MCNLQPLHDSAVLGADGLAYGNQESVAALFARISALEQSTTSSSDVDSKELTARLNDLASEVQSNKKSMQRLEESNRAMTEQLENQRCAMLYISDDVKACSEELKQLRHGGAGEGQQKDMSEMWAQIRMAQQQSKDNETELRCVRDEIVDSIADRLNRLQNTVAELQLPKCAIPSAVGSSSAKESLVLQREVSECKDAVQVVRHLIGDCASQQSVNKSMEEISAHVTDMRTNMEAVQQQVYSLKTSAVNEIVESRIADSLSQLRAEMSDLSRDRSAEMHALAEQLTSAFSAITELESQMFTATEDHNLVMEIHGEMRNVQHSLQNVNATLQQVSSMRSDAKVDNVDSTSQSRVEKIDVKLAEVAATVQQLTASTSLVREQLMNVSAQSNHSLAESIQGELQQLGSAVQMFQEAQTSLQQTVSMHEQTVAGISVRVDRLDNSVARSGAVAQAADSHSVLTDSSMQELRGTVETLQQAVKILSEPTSAGDSQVDTDVLSELRQDVHVLAQQVTALECAESEGLTVLQQRVQDTESSLAAVLEKVRHSHCSSFFSSYYRRVCKTNAPERMMSLFMPSQPASLPLFCDVQNFLNHSRSGYGFTFVQLGSISEDVSRVQADAGRIEELSRTANTLAAKVQDVEGAVHVATQDIQTAMETNCTVSNSLPDLRARVSSVEAAQLDNAEFRGLSDLQNAVTLLTDKVEGKADCDQVVCLEKRLEAAEAINEQPLISIERLDIVSDKLEHLNCKVIEHSTKSEADGQVVTNLTSELVAIAQKVDCLQVGCQPCV